jgi:CRP-like cAMP-binding protein
MNRTHPLRADADPTSVNAMQDFQSLIRRLVKDAADLQAIESGEIDAIMDPAFGKAILLPAGQTGLRESEVRRRARQLPKSGHKVANTLLAALPRELYERLLVNLVSVTLTYGEVLYEPGQRIGYVYFPVDALVSLLTQVDANHSLEVGLVGREGMVGIPLALGADISTNRALVQGTGMAMRMEAACFRQEFLQSVPLQREVYRFIYTLMAQTEQTAACNHHHCVEERLARWLLMTHDRVQSNEIYLTHNFLASMLGVRREGVSLAANSLQERKLIRYRRGHIRILNRRRLEASACVCYKKINKLLS